jgi:hypothetical protein
MSIEIINRALIKIGEGTITSLSQTPYGELMGYVYEDQRKMLLSTHYWRFALKRARLAELDEATGSTAFAYAYALPADYLVLKDFGEFYKMPNVSDAVVAPDVRYSIEGNRILCRQPGNINITYIADVSDPKLFTPLFKEALIALIAAEMSVRIKQGAEYKQLFLAEFEKYIAQAQMNNEIVRDMETMPDNSWVNIRDTWSVGEW